MTRTEIEAMGGHVFVWAGTEEQPLMLRRIPAEDGAPWEMWRRRPEDGTRFEELGEGNEPKQDNPIGRKTP